MTPRARERLEKLATYCEQIDSTTWSDAARNLAQYCATELRETLLDCDTVPAPAPVSVVPMPEGE